MASFIPPTCTFSRELKHTVVFLGLVVFVALIESLPRGHKHMLIFHSAGWIACHFTPACFCQICFFFTFKALGNDNMSLTLHFKASGAENLTWLAEHAEKLLD